MKLKNIPTSIWRNKWKSLLAFIAFIAIGIAAAIGIYNYSGKRSFLAFESSWTALGETVNIADLQAPEPNEKDNFFLSPSFLAEKNNKYPIELTHPRHRKIEGFSKDYSAFSITSTGDYHMGVGTNIEHWLESSDLKPKPRRRPRRGRKSARAPTPAPTPESAPFNEKETALACLELLNSYQARLSALSHDSLRPHAWRDPLIELDTTPLSHLNPIMRSLDPLQARAILYIMAENPDLAALDLLTMIRLQNYALSSPYLLGHLIHIATFKANNSVIWEGLKRHSWDDATLALFESKLAHIDFRKNLLHKMREEVCFTHQETKRMLDDPDYLEEKTKEFEAMTDFLLEPLNTEEESTLDNIGRSARHVIASGYLSSLSSYSLNTYRDTLFYPHGIKAETVSTDQVRLARNAKPSDPLLRFTPPSWIPLQLEKTLQAQATLHNIRTAIALERFRLKHQHYPVKLSDLAPDYLPEELKDVITGKPLRYQIKADGTPLIYSIGSDEIDDDGRPNRSPSKGDWAWMYSPPNDYQYSDYRQR